MNCFLRHLKWYINEATYSGYKQCYWNSYCQLKKAYQIVNKTCTGTNLEATSTLFDQEREPEHKVILQAWKMMFAKWNPRFTQGN